MSIPKKIWALWLNFEKQTASDVDIKINWYKERIIHLHPAWEVNIIDEWDTLLSLISDNVTLTSLVHNNYVQPAIKSDAIRYYLLNTFGGFWIDLSTFLVCPLDIYLEKQPSASFIGYYTPSFMVEEIIFDSMTDMFDSVKWTKILEKFKNKQKKYIHLNRYYSKFPFIPESFFIASAPQHYIINNIMKETMIFWDITLPLVSSKEDVCFYINKNMSRLANEIFIINSMDLNILNTFNEQNFTDKTFIGKLRNNVWRCGYIITYLQMYKSLTKYIHHNNTDITGEYVGTLYDHSPHKHSLCFNDHRINSCQNIIVTNNKNSDVLYLLSLSNNRLIKWADTDAERISFHNTYIESMLKKVLAKKITKDNLIDTLIKNGIYQIKFSHWTRNSPIVNMLMKIYTTKTIKKTRKNGKRKSKRFTINANQE
jgi:hypothetical protein